MFKPAHALALAAGALYLVVGSVLFAQTEGFITTRPTCVPPTGGVQDQVNYIQGPDPLRLDDGSITLLVDAGHCCTGGHWEGIFALTYPAAGSAGTPRFSPLWGSNNWGNTTSRNEHEAPFPSGLFFSGQWRVIYTSTFFPTSATNRDRVARLDLPNLYTQAQIAQVTNSWIKPIDPACSAIGSCAGPGSGVLGTIVRHPDGSAYVYHPDGNFPQCGSGWLRHRISASLTVENPTSHDGCLTFEGRSTAPPLI